MFYTHALKVLQDSNYKVTTARKLVLEGLVECEKPVSPYELQKILKSELNHVTIYRILNLLQSLHLVHVIAGKGFVKCSIPTTEGCHHFLVCNNCNIVSEYAAVHNHLKMPQNTNPGFQVTGHLFELQGLCSSCQKVRT